MNEINNINLDDNNDNYSKKTGKNRFGKVTAFLMAMVMVSGGSIAVYRQITERPVSTVTDTADTDTDKKLIADTVSLINTGNNSATALTTEEVVQKVLPSVVGVESEFTVTSNNNGYYYGFGMPATSVATGTGTG